MKSLLPILFLYSCGPTKSASEPEIPNQAERVAYVSASERVISGFLENNRIVSRRASGEPKNFGDSLIWSGIALFGLPCESGTRIEDQLIGELKGGYLMRHPTLYANDGNLDGAMGLYFGIADRIKRCGSAAKWAEPIRKHIAYVEANHYGLNPNSDSKLERYFDYVLDLLGNKLGVRIKPPTQTKLALGLEIGEWAELTVLSQKSCFRIHLGWLALSTVESLGESWPDVVKANFCNNSNRTDMPAIDHYCGRKDIKEWLPTYKPNEWEYRHQRCGKWETPDGHGYQTPGIDFLVGMRLGYKLD